MKRILNIVMSLLVAGQVFAAATDNAFPTKVLVVLAQYSDVKFQDGNDVAAFTNFFNGANYSDGGATGSVQKYFSDQSYGKFVPQFEVVGPVTLAGTRASYGANDEYGDDVAADYMVAEACELAHAQGVNFAPYDVNGDGYVDAVIVVYAGPGETEKWPDYVYPQTSVLYDDLVIDNKIVSLYSCVPELKENKKRAGIGEMVYQFSHILGLPTLSDTDGGDEKTLGDWDVMDHGCYNNDGNTPAAYSAYERFYLGWVEPILLNEPMNVRLEDLNKAGACAIVTRSGQTNLLGNNPDPREFYILENRQQSGWDKYLPGHGLLLTKIDYVRSRWEGDEVNVLIKGKPSLLVDIVEADGKAPKYKASNPNNGYLGKPGDAYPTGATSKTMFSEKWWFDNVSEKGSVVTFLFNGGVEEGGCAVRFYVPSGTGKAAKSNATEEAPFAGVTLPSVTPNSGYEFLGWATRTNSKNPDAGQPGDKFYPMSDCSVYAVMKDNTRFWVEYDIKGVEIGDYFDFNGAYIKTNDIHDIAVSFGKKEGYSIPSATTCYVKVECGGKKLKDVAAFKNDSVFVSIPASELTGDVIITITNTRYQDAESGCADYEHVFADKCGIGTNDLGVYEWRVSMTNIEADTDFESARGAKFGSGTKAPKGVSFYTMETAGCGIKKVEVEASMGSGGDALLDVYVAGNFIGNTEELTQTSTTYTYQLDKPYSGSLEIAFTNTKGAIYIKRIAVFYDYLDPAQMEDIIPEPGIDEDDDPGEDPEQPEDPDDPEDPEDPDDPDDPDDPEQGIENIIANPDVTVRDIQGRIVEPTQPGLYIVSNGEKVYKVVIK